MRANKMVPVFFETVVLAILLSGSAVADHENCVPAANPPPGFVAPSAVGDGLSFVDWDICNPDDPCDPWVQDTVELVPDSIFIIDPCGRSIPLGTGQRSGPKDWREWTVPGGGCYTLIATVRDLAACEWCMDDNDMMITVTFCVESFGPDMPTCRSCGSGGSSVTSTVGTVPEAVSLRFPLGTTTDGDSAGAPWVREDQPSRALATRAVLHYDLQPKDVVVIWDDPVDPNAAPLLRQVLTPQLLADIRVDPNVPDYRYEILFFARQDVSGYDEQTGLYTVVQNGTAYRKWVIENPAQDPNDFDTLYVSEYVDNGSGSLSLRVRYEYTGSAGSSDWTLVARDNEDDVLRTEYIQWVTEPNDPQGRPVEERQYSVWENSTETYRVHDQYTQFDGLGARAPGDRSRQRLTQRIVDPNLTTTWTYDAHGYEIQSVQRPDGSWTAYKRSLINESQTDFSWLVEETSGWKDQGFEPNTPYNGSGVRCVRMTYDPNTNNQYRLKYVEEWVNSNRVRRSDYDYTDPNEIVEQAWLDGTTNLTTTTAYWNGDRDRTDYVEYPDGRIIDYDYDDAITFTPSLDPDTTPATYDPNQSDPNAEYHYREVVYKSSSGLVTSKSTREVVILDPGGLPVFEEAWFWTGTVWARIGWTNWTYDKQGRPTGVYHSNGTYETTTYDSCCTKTVTDSTGVATQYTNDPLGRTSTVTRLQIDATDEYPEQPAITTSYDYDTTPGQVTVSTQDANQQMSQTTVREYDKAKRLAAVTSNSGTSAALKTMYTYGTATSGGQKVTVYRDYPANATGGTPGVRDQISEYYRDGQIKSVTGAGLVGTFHDYASDGNEETWEGHTWTKVATGNDANSPRYTETYYDTFQRVDHIVRPEAGGTGTLTTAYYYDDDATGKLWKVAPSAGQAATLYEYDDLGNVLRSGLDTNHNDTLDLAGSDRVTKSEMTYEYADDAYWQVSRTWVYPTSGETEKLTSSRYVQLTNFDSGVIGQTKTVDALGNETVSTTTLDRGAALVTETVLNPPGAYSNTAGQIRHGGRLEYAWTQSGVTTQYAYDNLGRRTQVTDGRGNTTVTAYDAAGRVDYVENEASNRTTYTYYAPGTDYPGRLQSVQDPNGGMTYYDYDPNAPGMPVRHTWGHVPLPTWTQYDSYGQRWKLHTYRTDASWTGSSWPEPGEGDVTTWTYDEATGLLETKLYADSSDITYTYSEDGKLETRTWARDVVTTYAYDPNTGDLTGISYSNEDPNNTTSAVTFQYDRLGRRTQISDAAGTRTLAYDPNSLQPLTETFDANSMFGARVVKRVYEGSGDNTYPGRFKGLQVGTQNDPNADYYASYGYEEAGGRLEHVSGPGFPSGSPDAGAWYSYVPNSDLVLRTSISDGSGNLASTMRGYESDRDLLSRVQNRWRWSDEWLSAANTKNISNYSYTNDTLARRTGITYAGRAFSPGEPNVQTFGYNDRNELTSSSRGDPNWSYAYDPIGNRVWAAEPNEPNRSYLVNAVNQYTTMHLPMSTPLLQNFEYDADGNVTNLWMVGDMTCDGYISFADINAFTTALSSQSAYEAAYPNCNYMNADINGDGVVSFADIDAYTALRATGNNAFTQAYVWDGENRLVKAQPPGDMFYFLAGTKKAEYAYDYLGRRVQKKVWTYSGGSWGSPVVRKYVWSGWLLMMELDGNNNVVRKYTWGLDLAGQNGSINSLEGAGGVGGLLAVSDPNDPNDPNDPFGDFLYCHDGNGNVSQVVNWSYDSNDPNGAIVAKYEYDPYGQRINHDPNVPEYDQPFRWSTKYFDTETGLSYFGGRYYHAGLGRWINRDPIEELGGRNLYAYVLNSPTNRVDYLGRMAVACPSGVCGCPGRGGEISADPNPPPHPHPWDRKYYKPDCSDCDEYCQTDDAQKALRANANSAAAVVCRPDGCKCPCLDTSNPRLAHPKTKADNAIARCKKRHEEVHVNQITVVCACWKYPCIGKHLPPFGDSNECQAYLAQWQCLREARRSVTCDETCWKQVTNEMIATEIAASGKGMEGEGAPGCKTDTWGSQPLVE